MKNIIFDIGGVIFLEKSNSVLNKFNIKEEDIKELSIFFENTEKLDKGLQTVEERFESCNFRKELVDNYKNIIINCYKFKEVNNELLDIIKKLKDKYNFYILSDNGKNFENYIKKKSFYNHFSGSVFSCDYSTMKKEGKLFEILITKYNLDPKESLFIDDIEINIEKAKEYGLNTYRFKCNEDLIKYLKDNKLLD